MSRVKEENQGHHVCAYCKSQPNTDNITHNNAPLYYVAAASAGGGDIFRRTHTIVHIAITVLTVLKFPLPMAPNHNHTDDDGCSNINAISFLWHLHIDQTTANKYTRIVSSNALVHTHALYHSHTHTLSLSRAIRTVVHEYTQSENGLVLRRRENVIVDTCPHFVPYRHRLRCIPRLWNSFHKCTPFECCVCVVFSRIFSVLSFRSTSNAPVCWTE